MHWTIERESRATDMLLNYETVKTSAMRTLSWLRYDLATRQYQVRAAGPSLAPCPPACRAPFAPAVFRARTAVELFREL